MVKTHLTRDKKTGDWYTKDGRFRVVKVSDGWDVYDINPDTGCRLTYPTGWGSKLSNVRSLIYEIT